uniref:Uncharacterized protein n=1 Tax=Chromera velia CCMP2878 TaxID=1169474 RepID=A0A0G4FVL9_9ALVE|eukprot:Cvel_18986.t1-p1 / transcript=Cvel_18986.t1 / gene=Cvel_18986 / organism=Chromera_velia_CCMP2878 / gene_product=hypothetical protein / transcript_product=hypothetical protein / location=Cvel_scaffold1606:25649-27241(-) / protein_length=214 / sequence_SO=supercontig / SO=protein_coding / is_pseudo=false
MELKKDINSLTYSDICPFADHKADVLAYKSTLHGAESKGSKKESGSGHELGVPLRSGIPERGTKTSRARILSKTDADDELLPDTGCTFGLLNEEFVKYSVSQKKRRTEFNLAIKGGPDASLFITDNVHLFHFSVRDEFGKVRQVPEEGAIHPSVGKGLLPYVEKQIFLSKRWRRRSYVRLTDIEGRSFRAPVERSGRSQPSVSAKLMKQQQPRR